MSDTSAPAYQRILLKLSGEALRSPGSMDNISPEIVARIAEEIAQAHRAGVQIGLVVGGGNAALCAAITARRAGASVMLLEASPKEFRGGNSRHTRNIRYVHAAKNDFLTGPYTEEECFNDLMGVTKGNTIESMARLVIRNSNNVGYWMMEQGVHFQPAMRGTLHLSRTNAFFLGGGKALINAYYATAEKLGVKVLYDAEVTDLEIRDGEFKSAKVNQKGTTFIVEAKAVVLASGGYQANTEWLTRAWGPEAANFLIRGTPYDKGRMLQVMMDHGAKTLGDPTQGHCVAIDGRAPKFDGGICTRLDCVPFGIAVNRDCKRFYNEGEEIWPKRYAIWGRLVAQQPGQIAYVIIDSKTCSCLPCSRRTSLTASPASPGSSALIPLRWKKRSGISTRIP